MNKVYSGYYLLDFFGLQARILTILFGLAIRVKSFKTFELKTDNCYRNIHYAM